MTRTESSATLSPMVDRPGRRDIVALAALLLAAIGIPLWLAAAAGAIGLPSNDDWVYMRAASSLFETGRVDMPGHTTAFIGQLALVQPFLWLSGGEPWAFTAFGLVMASIGIAATYLLARRFVGTGSAVIVVLLVIAFPGFARTSASFMTDVPAYALIMLCLLLGTRWLQDDGGRVTLVASLGVGLLAVSIREFALAAPIAILIAAWARNRAGERVWLAGLSIALAVGVSSGVAMRCRRRSRGTAAPAPLKLGGLIDVGPAFATLAAVLLPATLLHAGQRIASFSREQIIVAVALVCFVVFDPGGPLLGNIWTSYGLAGQQRPHRRPGPGDRRDRVGSFSPDRPVRGDPRGGRGPELGSALLAQVSSVSTARGLAIRIAGSREGPLALFLLGYAAELVLYSLLGGLFDRYLYPMVPVAAILLLRSAQPLRFGRSHAFAHGAFAWLIASALIIAANSFAYDAARHREGEAAVALGYDAQTVDAGYEWVGTHGSGPREFELIT